MDKPITDFDCPEEWPECTLDDYLMCIRRMVASVLNRDPMTRSDIAFLDLADMVIKTLEGK